MQPSKTFHEGELQFQDQFGMREKFELMAQRMMHDFIPDKQRAFFEALEYILLGTVDQHGSSHASLLTGALGFIQTPVPNQMVIRTGPREHLPAFDALAIGQPVGVLGIDFSCRRRNRMHGRIVAIDEHTITIGVAQFYGNCPKYISIREICDRALPVNLQPAETRETLSPADTELISAADTFFIASYIRDDSGAPYEGVDISHRGGQPGFVAVDSHSQITIPDYKGNYLFNTLGNLLINPDAGLLFVDYETGDQLHVQGETSLIDDEAALADFVGAQRLLRVKIKRVNRQAAATSLRWRFVEFSSANPIPGSSQ